MVYRLKWVWEPWRADMFASYVGALEVALIFVKLQYAALLLFIPVDPFITAFADMMSERALLSFPFLLSALSSSAGIILNARGDCKRFSSYCRIFGAALGMSIWMFALAKNMLLGEYGAGTNPWMAMAVIGSLWIIRRGVLGFPRPVTR